LNGREVEVAEVQAKAQTIKLKPNIFSAFLFIYDAQLSKMLVDTAHQLCKFLKTSFLKNK
jgi:hypothetical protein